MSQSPTSSSREVPVTRPRGCSISRCQELKYLLSNKRSQFCDLSPRGDEAPPRKSLALEDIRTDGLRMLGTCVGARSAREQFLQEKIDYEAARGKDFRGAAIHHATEGEDDGVKGEVAGWAVPDLMVGNRAEVLVDQPGRVGVLIRELCGTGILVCQRDDREIVLGVG
jgi:hypothetical protein